MEKKKVVIGLFLVAVLVAIAFALTKERKTPIDKLGPENSNDLKEFRSSTSGSNTYSPSLILAYDEHDPRELAAYYDNIFIGRVESVGVTEKREILVFTHYDIDVLREVKGDTPSSIDLAQQGGIVDGIWTMGHRGEYSMIGGEALEPASTPALSVGEVYLFTANYSQALNAYVLGPTSTSFRGLGADGIGKGSSHLDALIERNQHAQALIEAADGLGIPAE